MKKPVSPKGLDQDISDAPLRLKEFAALVGMSYRAVWRAAKRGEIESSRLGSTYLIPRRVANKYLEGRKGPVRRKAPPPQMPEPGNGSAVQPERSIKVLKTVLSALRRHFGAP